MLFLIITIILISLELFYFKLADKFNIIDKPNYRSSHSEITLRGAGIIFVFVSLMTFYLGYSSWELTLSIILAGTISFIDDVITLPSLPRFLTHIFAVILVIYSLDFNQVPIWILPLIAFILIAWLNIYNFMDGINGIMILYSLVGLISLYLISDNQQDKNFLIVAIIASLIFSFFNVRTKAKAFSGDVGSISMSIILGYFLLKNIIEKQNITYILFILVYSLDSITTIFYRLLRKENIFKPHRTHLYQYLANELKINHIIISFCYAIIQLIINLICIYFLNKYDVSWIFTIIVILISFILYILIRNYTINKIKK